MKAYLNMYLDVICLSCLTQIARGNNCLIFPDVQNDMHMKRYTFRRVVISSLYECASECMTSSTCKSFNYDTESHTCHLNKNSSEYVDVDPRPGFLFSDIKHWNKSLTGPCSKVSCSASSRCQMFRNDQARCVPEFKGCGPPPDVSYAVVTFDGDFLGAEALYTCRKDFRPCSSHTGSVCKATGKWSDIRDLCKQFTWHNPTVRFLKDMPCGQQRSFLIKVTGKPTDETEMIFNLEQGGDMLLHVNVRFVLGKVIFNSYLKGSWGREIVPSGLPFRLNKNFLFEIALRNGTFKVKVDGDHFFSLRERLPGATPEKLLIVGNVKLESVIII